MSGYLQRMAASVLSRERAIHPAVGSLWGPQGSAGPIEQSGEILAPSLKPNQARDAEADRNQAQMPTKLNPDPERAESNRAAREQSSTSRADASVSSEDAETRLLLPMQNAPADQRIHSVMDPANALPADASPAGNESGQQAEQPQAQRRIYTPLVAESAQRSVAVQNLVMQASAVSYAGAQQRHPVAQPAHEPDTIEIHIGRIEVLAAQPQLAQRPPARPAHKSLDLREYLERGGRAR
jgi:hypothetical protein